MSASAPLLQTIEPDDVSSTEQVPSGNIGSGNAAAPKPVAPTNRTAMASTPSDAEAGIAGIFRQVDDDGESYWVFETRDLSINSTQPSRPANPIDSRFLPIVLLALIFNVTNAIGFTYACVSSYLLSLVFQSLTFRFSFVVIVIRRALCVSSDRDAKQRWASSMAASGWNFGLGSIGGQLIGSAVKNSVGRVFT
ncbi:Golgi apparatus membrane protein TVP23 [Sanghuangporus baumii]|uniref:Golgi apparatus membrane protein TVP23 n=1 Tax=Sanghuangporus baumii TaxID=108892 RepID=A0A9Q5N9D7_SANBA|nr:Golgi apparatus membrane protein TVP23 [Sanghuangporus baumii]